jgi:ribosomal protein S18 acetylase RimI-like enzyme
MPSYRFCRPDDLTLLVRAINDCYLLHYPSEPVMTAERLKEHMTVLAVRPGNCMVALEHQQPVGVVVSTKRDVGVWIQAIGCQPAVQRQGIAAQLLEALIRKIAIQRAPEVTVDVPARNSAAVRLFESVGCTVRGRYVSYQGSLADMIDTVGVTMVPVPALLEHYRPWHSTAACWERNAASLAGYGTLPQGYAYAASGVIQGYLIHRDDAILDLALAPDAEPAQVIPALLSRMRIEGYTHATLAKVPEYDPIGPALIRLGFLSMGEHVLMGRALRSS